MGWGLDGAFDVWKRTKSRLRRKKTVAIEAIAAIEGIEAIEEMALRGCVCFAIMWGWQNGGGWWIFWKNAKKWGESVEFFCIFCNFA